MGLEAEEAAGAPTSVLPPRAAARVLRTAVVFTFVLEAAGALALWLAWRGDAGAAGAAATPPTPRSSSGWAPTSTPP